VLADAAAWGCVWAPEGRDLELSGDKVIILATMTETLPLAQVKAHLSELVGRVNSQHDRVTVTVHGRPSAVLLSLDDLEALEETIAILSDTDTMRQLAASDAELARSEGETQQSLADAMGRRGVSG
jgi:prevent-host-death family protein